MTSPIAETAGYTTVASKVISLKKLPANAVVLTLNVCPWQAGSCKLLHKIG